MKIDISSLLNKLSKRNADESEYTYDAFISYRHTPRSSKAAEKLQRLLEGHKMKYVDKDGNHRFKTLRVFRDREELPVSSNLGDDIENALQNSRYLIVICVPELMESKWCMKEIDMFRSRHGNRNTNILPLLVEGEPYESFPPQIRTEIRTVRDEDGAEREVEVEVEPLGADVRAETDAEMLKLLKKTEYLRIAAPIMGCSFDTLYQRAKRHRNRQIAIIASIVAAAAIGFSAYSVHMLKRISDKQSELYRNESMRLATIVNERVENGDYFLAMLLARRALPENINHPERPMIPEAVTALRNAVTNKILEQETCVIGLSTRISYNTSMTAIYGAFDEGRKVATTDHDKTYLYDARTGQLLFSCNGFYVMFNDDASLALRMERVEVGDGEFNTTYDLFNTETGEVCYSETYDVEGNWTAAFEEDTGNCYILDHVFGEGWDDDGTKEDIFTVLDIVTPEGRSLGASETPAWIRKKYDEGIIKLHVDPFGWMAKYQYEPDKGFTPYWIKSVFSDLEKDGYTIRGANEIDNGNSVMVGVRKANDSYTTVICTKDRTWSTKLGGECFYEENLGVIYQKLDSNINIYFYNSDVLKNRRFLDEKGKSTMYSRVSTDGSRLLETHSVRVGESVSNSVIWDANDFSKPLLKCECKTGDWLQSLFYTTPDMRYAFYQEYTSSGDGSFILWNVDEGNILEFDADGENNQYSDRLSVSADGRHVAIGYKRDSDIWIEVRSAEDGSIEHVFEPEDFKYIHHIEFEGDRLLVSDENNSIIFDLTDEDSVKTFAGGNVVFGTTDQYLTSDGLLLCTVDYADVYLTGIYDIDSGEQLFDDLVVYKYDETNGALVYQEYNDYAKSGNDIHVAYRDKTGKFTEKYVLSPQTSSSTRITSADSGCFVLTYGNHCKVYNTETGEEVLHLITHDGRYTAQMVVANGTVYEMWRRSSDKAITYPILSLDELIEKCDEYLTTKNGTRTLTEIEEKKYFIAHI